METLERNPFVGSSSCDSVSPNRIVRKFINSAIYVEKPLTATISSESTTLSHKYSNDDFESLVIKTKRCTCSTNKKNCPCHLYNNDEDDLDSPKEPERPLTITKTQSLVVQKTAKIAKKPTAVKPVETKKSTAIIGNRKSTIDFEKKAKTKTATKQTDAERDKELVLEQERRNFRNWLETKKKAEIEQKKRKQKEEEERQLKAMEKEKRQLENQLNFQLWLKKKEEAHLEKRIREQMELIGELEKKEQTVRDNEKAFTDWLKSSKNKQKPTPLNKGIESLCSSSSVTYVNPNPWNATSGTDN